MVEGSPKSPPNGEESRFFGVSFYPLRMANGEELRPAGLVPRGVVSRPGSAA